MKNFEKLIIIVTLTSFFPNVSYAYIDPGGISAFIQILFASILASFVFLRSYISNFLSNIKNFFLDVKNYLRFSSQKKDTIIFCESNSYSVYFYELLKSANEKKVNYIYLCENGDKNINKLSIKKDNVFQFNFQFFLILIISNLKCNNLILTTPDFGNKNLNLTKNCKKIIYFFHSIVSSNMIYNERAFDNYDIICCVGKHHYLEFNERFSSLETKNKNLVKCGYPYLDYLTNVSNINIFEKNHILIAPTWNPKNSNFYHDNYINVVEELLKNDFKVTFRPHPEFLRRFENKFNDFSFKFEKNSNFKTDTTKSNIEVMEKCEFLVTDWSGVSFEFAYTFKRPVIFVEVPKKVLNDNYLECSNQPIEITDRIELGTILIDLKNQNITSIIEDLRQKESDYKIKIEKNLKKNVYNLKSSSQQIINLLI